MSYPKYPIKTEVLSIDTKVTLKKSDSKEKLDSRIWTIRDIAIYNGDARKTGTNVLNYASLSEGGILHYLLHSDEGGSGSVRWVPTHCVNPLPQATDEVQQTYQITNEELAHLGFGMVSWKHQLEARPDNSKLPEVVTLLMAIQYDKEGGYGSSWKGKGEYRGIMSNIDRKYDRLDKMTQDEINGNRDTLEELEKSLATGATTSESVGESKIDAVADLANYGLLYMTWLKETYPLTFKVWVEKNVPKYLRDKIMFLQE